MGCLGSKKVPKEAEAYWISHTYTYVTCATYTGQVWANNMSMLARSCKTWAFGWLKGIKKTTVGVPESFFWTLGVFQGGDFRIQVLTCMWSTWMQVLEVCWGCNCNYIFWSHRQGWIHWIATHVPKPSKTRWWFQICFMFTPKIGGNSHFD